jgi:hypothetical protein
MSAKPRYPWLAAMVFMVALAGESCYACHKCKQTPCALVAPPAPAFECVTEMVPCTVMKTKTRVDLVPVCTKTVMETKLELTYDEQVRTVCKPMFDTVFMNRCYTVCRPVCETTMVCRPYRVCRPVTTSRQVTEYCLKPYTELITVPAKTRCGECGHAAGGCTCKTVARTCYKRVPVVREVTETHMVSEIQTQMVPETRWRMVAEQRVEQVPVTTCRLVPHTVRVKVPRLVSKCVPKTLVYKKAVLTCEEIPVIVYRPVLKMVPVIEASPQAIPSSQGVTVPSGQAGAMAPGTQPTVGAAKTSVGHERTAKPVAATASVAPARGSERADSPPPRITRSRT